MITLDEVKAKFLLIYPPEKNVRERRFKHAGYKCEMTGSTTLLELHHVIEGKRRRTFFERFLTTRCVSENSHKGSGKADMIRMFRKEVQDVLLKDFTPEETLIILKICGLILNNDKKCEKKLD